MEAFPNPTENLLNYTDICDMRNSTKYPRFIDVPKNSSLSFIDEFPFDNFRNEFVDFDCRIMAGGVCTCCEDVSELPKSVFDIFYSYFITNASKSTKWLVWGFVAFFIFYFLISLYSFTNLSSKKLIHLYPLGSRRNNCIVNLILIIISFIPIILNFILLVKIDFELSISLKYLPIALLGLSCLIIKIIENLFLRIVYRKIYKTGLIEKILFPLILIIYITLITLYTVLMNHYTCINSEKFNVFWRILHLGQVFPF
jgi:hypothetical protein